MKTSQADGIRSGEPEGGPGPKPPDPRDDSPLSRWQWHTTSKLPVLWWIEGIFEHGTGGPGHHDAPENSYSLANFTKKINNHCLGPGHHDASGLGPGHHDAPGPGITVSPRDSLRVTVRRRPAQCGTIMSDDSPRHGHSFSVIRFLEGVSSMQSLP
jgi:hypothetical protein